MSNIDLQYEQNKEINTLIGDIEKYIKGVFTEKIAHNLKFKKLVDGKKNLKELLKVIKNQLSSEIRVKGVLLDSNILHKLETKFMELMQDDDVFFYALEPLTDQAIEDKLILLDKVGAILTELLNFLLNDKNVGEDDLFTYGSIVFNFTKKTLEIGTKRGSSALQLTKDFEINEPNLKTKTQGAIKLLFAILRKVKDNNTISLRRNDYRDITVISNSLERSNKPFDIGEYMTNVNSLFKVVGLGWRLVKKRRKEEYELKEMS